RAGRNGSRMAEPASVAAAVSFTLRQLWKSGASEVRRIRDRPVVRPRGEGSMRNHRRSFRFAAFAALAGCGLLDACLSPRDDHRVYTPIQLVNPVSVVRENQPVIVPLAEVKSRYPSFDPSDFCVGQLSSNWNPRDYDPVIATDPPPNIP